MEGNINEYKNIEYRVKEFENKIAMLVQENERLNGLIRTKNDDIEQLEKEKLQIHSEMMKYKNYEHKIAENEQIVQRLNDQLHNFKRDKEKLLEKNDHTDTRVRELENHLFMNNQEK